ncbi:MAG: hypothetical protein AAGI49_14375, partial [Bacteroidota bacterium]
VESGKEIRTFSGHTSYVSSVAFSPNGQYALSGSEDSSVKLWEVESGKEIRTFSGHTSYVSSVAFSPNGKYALSGSSDRSVKLWEVEANMLLEQHHHQLAALSPQQIKDYDLIAAIDSTQGAWAKIVAAEGAMQLKAFGIYYVQEVASNNNPDIFNPYYERAITCYQRANNRADSEAYIRAVGEIYAAWSTKLWKAKQCEIAKEKALLAFELEKSPFVLEVLDSIHHCLQLPYNRAKYIAQIDKRTLADYYYQQEQYEQAFVLYRQLDFNTLSKDVQYALYEADLEKGVDRFEELFPNLESAAAILEAIDFLEKKENAAKANELYVLLDFEDLPLEKRYAKYQAGLEKGVDRFEEMLATEDIDALITYAQAFFEDEKYEQTLTLVEKRFALNPTMTDRQNVYVVALQLGEDRFEELFLSLEKNEDLLEAISYFQEQEATNKVQQLYDQLDIASLDDAQKLDYYQIMRKMGEDRLEVLLAVEDEKALRSYIEALVPDRSESDSSQYVGYRALNAVIDRYLEVIYSRGDSESPRELTPSDRRSLSNYKNSYAWYALLNSEWAVCEKIVHEGIQFDPENLYFYTNLPPALLFQSKYKAAESEYEEWMKKEFNLNDLPYFWNAFLDDFETFEQKGIIPEAHRAKYEEIKTMLERAQQQNQ